MTIDISGIYPPIVTPFTAAGSLDLDALAFDVERWDETGLSGYVVFGSNGESVHLDEEEKLEVLRTVAETTGGKQVIAGTGLQSTEATIRLTAACAERGAHAALVITPSFYTLSRQQMVAHYTAVADASPVPIIIYNVPKFTGVNLPAETVVELAGHPNIAGIKDSSADVAQMSAVIAGSPPDFRVLTGSANVLYPACAVGARGAITALANIAPDLCVRLYELARDGEGDAARELQLRLLPANVAVTKTYGVPGLKRAMDMTGYRGGYPRPPLGPLPESDHAALRKILETAGIGMVNGAV